MAQTRFHSRKWSRRFTGIHGSFIRLVHTTASRRQLLFIWNVTQRSLTSSLFSPNPPSNVFFSSRYFFIVRYLLCSGYSTLSSPAFASSGSCGQPSPSLGRAAKRQSSEPPLKNLLRLIQQFAHCPVSNSAHIQTQRMFPQKPKIAEERTPRLN